VVDVRLLEIRNLEEPGSPSCAAEPGITATGEMDSLEAARPLLSQADVVVIGLDLAARAAWISCMTSGPPIEVLPPSC
jgi:hypothetical protein